LFCHAEKTIVVERAAATDVLTRDFHLKSEMLKDMDSGFRRAREEVVVKRVREQNNFLSRGNALVALHPAGKRLGSELRDLALEGHPGSEFGEFADSRS